MKEKVCLSDRYVLWKRKMTLKISPERMKRKWKQLKGKLRLKRRFSELQRRKKNGDSLNYRHRLNWKPDKK